MKSYQILFFSILIQCQISVAQLRIVLWSDAHSTLKTLIQQLALVDQQCQDFLKENPKGEVVVLVNGDFTSINDLSEDERGWLSLRALSFLKQKGCSVIFVPGNHDAFDWNESVNGAELFFQQMAYLNSLEIPILASNIVHPRHPLKSFIKNSYKLKTLKKETHLVGMTLDILPQKANLSDAAILRIMDRVEGYDETLSDVLPDLKKQGVEEVILAVHQGHKKLAKLAGRSSEKKPRIVQYLGGDDHVVASYKVNGSNIIDGGSHGSMSIIDYDEAGNLLKPIWHYAIDVTALAYIDPKLFDGEKTVNPFTSNDIDGFKDIPGFLDFLLELNQLIDFRESLSQTVVGFSHYGFQSSKKDMKKERTILGSLVAGSLELGVKSLLNPFVESEEPIIVFVHSGSYKKEGYFPSGDISVSLIKETYPYRNLAKAYRMSGEEITALYFSLREFYSKDDPKKYTPQMNFSVRENEGRLENFWGGEWHKLKKHKTYIIAFDGWLSTQNYGEGFRIPIWSETFSKHEPIASDIFQDIQIKNLPIAISNYESSLPKTSESLNNCQAYLD